MKKTGFQQFMEKGALICLVITAVFLGCWLIFGSVVLFSLMITFGTILYHFAVRIAVGAAVDRLTAGGVNYHAAWFRHSGSEKKLFRLMRVHRWKLKLPTYTPEKFSLKDNTPEQVVMNMCAAEIIHEINIAASFVPVLMSIAIPVLRETMLVFVITSTAAAVFDLLFVIIQRYNRPRMMRLIQRKNSSALNK
ncbi:MAG: hypothetical protein J6A19_09300 [Oscillospiraceae bacterium]|nr:hypothetical protein [Oscillospiraceae bacterium]